tara:strand:+ start:630 stop:998 length:369 start_codon:yes stop_codon:yes gene_type:complete
MINKIKEKAAATISVGTLGADTPEAIKEVIISSLKCIYDPEIPVNIWDLGLIYNITVHENRKVDVVMTLTSPMCPVAQDLVAQVETAAKEAPYVTDVVVDLVWDPPWGMESMSEDAQLLLGF